MDITLFDAPHLVRDAGPSTGVSPRRVEPNEYTVDVKALAKAASVTERTVRRWAREGLLMSAETVLVPGTDLKLRRWPVSAIAAVKQIAERHEIWLRRSVFLTLIVRV